MLVQTVSSFRRARKSISKKSPDRFRSPGFSNYYPANAVKADIPFPFGNGRMTAARASDFQLRHVIFPMQPSLLELMKYRFGNHTCNLEHRRVNGGEFSSES